METKKKIKNLIKEKLTGFITAENDNEYYDELMYLLETLNELSIIDNEAYEKADEKISKIWGYEVYN